MEADKWTPRDWEIALTVAQQCADICDSQQNYKGQILAGAKAASEQIRARFDLIKDNTGNSKTPNGN